MTPCRCSNGHVKEPYEMSMAWEPGRRSNFFFSPPAHLCIVTCITEISLIVTLSNQYSLSSYKCISDFHDINVRVQISLHLSLKRVDSTFVFSIAHLCVVESWKSPPLITSALGLNDWVGCMGCCLYTLAYSVRLHGPSPFCMTAFGRWGHLCRLKKANLQTIKFILNQIYISNLHEKPLHYRKKKLSIHHHMVVNSTIYHHFRKFYIKIFNTMIKNFRE